MPKSVLLLTRALAFAAERHTDQRRKGSRGEPYINHLAEVAALVATATEGRDPALVAAALLHDAIEDTGTTRAEIADAFGPDVADLVTEVTDDKSVSQVERKRMQVARAPRRSVRAKILKLADKTSNLRALAVSPPADWPSSQRRDYIAWAHEVAAGLRGANAWLEAEFDRASDLATAAAR